MNVIVVSQARLSSSRFPRKVVQDVATELSVIDLHLSRILSSKNVSGVVLAIADEPGAEEIVSKVKNKSSVLFSLGSIRDVLDRYYRAVQNIQADYIVRLTSDCPLIDPAIIDQVIEFCIAGDFDYVSNALEPNLPDGMDVEVFKKSILARAWKDAYEAKDREHVTPFIWREFFSETPKFKIGSFRNALGDYSQFRLTLDYVEDFEVIKHLVKSVGCNAGWMDYVTYLQENKTILALNEKFIRNEGY